MAPKKNPNGKGKAGKKPSAKKQKVEEKVEDQELGQINSSSTGAGSPVIEDITGQPPNKVYKERGKREQKSAKKTIENLQKFFRANQDNVDISITLKDLGLGGTALVESFKDLVKDQEIFKDVSPETQKAMNTDYDKIMRHVHDSYRHLCNAKVVESVGKFE